jgi:putative ABC transport system substrate-binding protein
MTMYRSFERILRAAKPADLPVQAPVRYELAVNLKTREGIRSHRAPSLLATADEVIE